jgi:hypothetical protein
MTPNQAKAIARRPRLAGRILGTEEAPPGILQRAANYVAAVARYRREHGWMLPLELSESRYQVCRSNSCGLYDATLDRCQHRKCGCTVKEKVTWSTERCPKKLWLPMFGPAPRVH